MPQKRRLPKKLIERILKKGKSVDSGYVLLKYLIFPDKQSSFAVIVSAKTAKKAVLRNKLKRRGRAIITKLLPLIGKGIFAILIFKKESVGVAFPELERTIIGLFKKAKITSV